MVTVLLKKLTAFCRSTASPVRFPAAFLLAVLYASCLDAQSLPNWDQRPAVRGNPDRVHLDYRLLRTWTQADLNKLPIRRSVPADFKALWKSALSSEDRELRRNALLAVGQAHSGGYGDFTDLAGDVLKTFRLEELRLMTRIDAARTLIILDAAAAAADLMKHLDATPDLRPLVEPALAQWKFKPASAIWLERVRQPDTARRSRLTLALNCIAVAGLTAAADDVLAIVSSPKFDGGLRLTAARTLAELKSAGLEEPARRLTATREAAASLAGVSLLLHHKGESTEQLLQSLLDHKLSPVAARAWERLNELNPDRIPAAVLAKTLQSRDARLRLAAVDNGRLRKDCPVSSLVSALDDLHPDVRCLARHALRDRERQAQSDGDSAVAERIRSEVSREFAEKLSWRGYEQACLLAGEIDIEPAAPAIAGLLLSPRDEVAAAAAWALKEIAVKDVLPQMLAYAVKLDTDVTSGDARICRRAEVVLTHLFESFGILRYQPADALMRKYIPKDARPQTWISRMTAVWALGNLHRDAPDSALVAQLDSRMMDWNSIPPEMTEVIIGCALAFGVMKHEPAVANLRKLASAMANDSPAYAALWSLHQITGEPIPQKTPRLNSRTKWFLIPVRSTGSPR